jgi:hypothetical protein
LVEFLEDDYEDERDLVLIGVNGIWSVFELQVSGSRSGGVIDTLTLTAVF